MKKSSKKPPESRKNGRFSFFNSGARTAAVAATAATVAILMSIIIFDLADDALALTRHGHTRQSVTVSELSELPDALAKKGIIKHPRLFSLYLSISDQDLKRKTAAVSADMDYRALLSAFTGEPEVKTVRITIPQRSSVADIIDIFVNNGLGSREGFIKAINESDFDYRFISDIPKGEARVFRLEGYLYPDTYDFYTEKDEAYYIKKLLDRFDSVMGELIPLCESAGMTLDQALTVASMIQCSAGFSSSYERMSAVIHNRLESGMPLSVPATSAYGISKKGGIFTHRADVELTDLDSPYNTFKNKGLPPGPICNPTKEALLCAIYPESSKYLYFVTLKNGSVLFAKTLSAHNENLSSASAD